MPITLSHRLFTKVLKCVIAWAALVILLSCSSSEPAPPWKGPELAITGLVMENRTQSMVSSANLLVPFTGNFVSCGNIAPGGVCYSGFPEQEFSGYPVEINWIQNGQTWTTGSVNLTPGEAVLEKGSAVVRVVIVAPGSAGAALILSDNG